MKQLFILLTVISTLLTTNSFAIEDKNIAEAALKSFNTAFFNAAEVKWSVTENMYRADFSLSGQYAAAFYTKEGDLVAVTRNISSLQLPVSLQAGLKKGHQDFWISNLFEVSTEVATEYYVTLETADQKLVLKASSNGEWSTYKKSRKI